MIANSYVSIIVLYLPLNEYDSIEFVTNIQNYLGLIRRLFLYKIYHKNVLPTNMLPYFFINNLLVMAFFIEVTSNIKYQLSFL